ncbi:MAG TPA: His-Xaa-Ser system protein HxsD [Pseudoalteromonas sp.]|nr:His-Xaa-Ser system protein HxsD [Pseudoalteromonas sp.]|tara:strand:- start:12400 stop:12669 length:270 start_codon:yes stop_codon:yes gene_type:complete
MKLLFKKQQYSEVVLRKALYWLQHQYQWALEDNENEWLIKVSCDGNDFIHFQSELNKLLNDYSLRDKLNSNTEDLKLAIIRKALKDLSQ